MLPPETAEIDLDILLFEDEKQQLVDEPTHISLPNSTDVKPEKKGSESEGEEGVSNPGRRQHAMNCIEEWTLGNLLEMSTDKSWAFNIASRRKTGKQATGMAKRRLLWPRRGVSTMRTMAQASKVAEMAHQALRDNVPITKRDIFYGDIPLFGKQSVVDTLVDDLAATWGLRRADLNIRAALKGVFVGSCLTLYLSHGETIRGLDREETLIPVGEDILRIHVDERCQWVLVVEKEAVFQTLVQLNFTMKYEDIGPGIVITGKGYPDLATRQLVAAFSVGLPDNIPILALVDGDPHGLEILATYMFGSQAMAHENNQLVAPRMQWIGVTIADLEELGIASSKMIELTWRDRRKATAMLESATLPKDWIAELERMVEIGFKAEIESVSATRASGPNMSGGSQALDSYLHNKIATILVGSRACVKQETKYEDDVSVKFELPLSPSLLGIEPEPESQVDSPFSSQQSPLEDMKYEPSNIEHLHLDFGDWF